MGCRIECVVDKNNTCCCLECEKYEECITLCDALDEYEFAVHETKTYQVIEDVRDFKSEIGILYVNDFNRKVLTKMFHGVSRASELQYLCLHVERPSAGKTRDDNSGRTERISLSVF